VTVRSSENTAAHQRYFFVQLGQTHSPCIDKDQEAALVNLRSWLNTKIQEKQYAKWFQIQSRLCAVNQAFASCWGVAYFKFYGTGR
jgi:hypothetical protein